LVAGRGDAKQRSAYEQLEWSRCANSYNYWRTTYGWLKLKSGEAIRWDTPFPCQNESGDLWQSGVSTTDIKTRQIGQTSNGIHFCAWDAMFHDATTWNYFGCDEDAGKDAIDRLSATLDRLPRWMLERARKTPGQREDETKKARRGQAQQAVTTVSFGLSKIRVWTGSVKKSQGLAGKVFWDDAAKHEDKNRKWQLMYPTIDDPDPKNRGQIIIIFNGEGEEFCYHQWEKANQGEVNLVAHFYPWMADPRRIENSYIAEDGRIRSPWYDEAEKQYLIEHPDADSFAFRAQFPETVREAIFLHGNSRFDMKSLNAIADVLKVEKVASIQKWGRWPRVGFLVWDESDAPPTFDRHPTGRCRLFSEPEPNVRYVVAVDAAGGKQASDFCVAMVGKVHEDGAVEQVFVYEAKVEPEDELVYNALALCIWYNHALLIPETGSSGHGQGFCNAAKLKYDYIYQAIRTSRYTDEEKLELGFATSTASRNPLLAKLGQALGRRDDADKTWIREPTFIIHDERTLDELHRFEIDPDSGKSGAPKGANDDLVITSALLLIGAEWMAAPRQDNARIFFPGEW
jgi:hypothetical protein